MKVGEGRGGDGRGSEMRANMPAGARCPALAIDGPVCQSLVSIQNDNNLCIQHCRVMAHVNACMFDNVRCYWKHLLSHSHCT